MIVEAVRILKAAVESAACSRSLFGVRSETIPPGLCTAVSIRAKQARTAHSIKRGF